MCGGMSGGKGWCIEYGSGQGSELVMAFTVAADAKQDGMLGNINDLLNV